MDARSAAEPTPLLDLTSTPDVRPLIRPTSVQSRHGYRPTEKDFQQAQADREASASLVQRQAAIRNGIDWNYCLVPGCGKQVPTYLNPSVLNEDAHNPDVWLPVCKLHGSTIWRTMNHIWKDPEIQAEMLAADARYNQAVEKFDQVVEAIEAAEAAKAETIYILRQNGLIKVGWTGDLGARLKKYGPNVELLCHYPGTRQDETNLHRQLRPSLAEGREWYHDDGVLALYVKNAIAEHGPPTYKAWWSKPKQPYVATKHTKGTG